jgi:hypothetical protein
MWARLLVLAAALAIPTAARAQHEHGGAAGEHTHKPTLSASAAFIAARFSTRDFVGDYQGLMPAVHYSTMRYAVALVAPLYRLERNGATYYGPGDVMAHAQLVLAGVHARAAGIALAVSAPTGSERDGLGMGHVMVMPAAWASYGFHDVTVGGSVGYGRAIAGGGHAGHGTGSIVDPMSFSEVTFGASGDLRLAPALSAGIKLAGAIATGEGTDRLIGGAHVVWVTGRVQTSAELQGGFVGDPFEVRGVLASAVRF